MADIMADNSVSSTIELTGGELGAGAGQHGALDPGNIPPGSGKANLLVVLGEPFTVEQQQLIIRRLSTELQSWDTQESRCDISQELQNFVAKAQSATEGANGEKTVEGSSDALGVTVLINPTLKSVVQRVRSFLMSPGGYRQLVYSGRAIHKSGCWVLQDSLFTFPMFADLLRGADIAQAIKSGGVSGTFNLSIFAEGEWANIGKLMPQLKVMVNPVAREGDASAGINQLTAYLLPHLTVTSTQDLLPSTNVCGNIRFSRPTLYVFPGSNGKSALFGVSGFNLLINGGYGRKACFWEFARHLDRIDALLVTHIGADNLFGLSAVLGRKASDVNLHPDIGYVYMNAVPGKHAVEESALSEASERTSQRDALVLNLSSEASAVVSDIRQMGLTPHPLTAPAHGAITPTNLYHKIGHGTLEMYTLNPVHDSKVLKDFMSQWSKNVNGFTSKSGAVPLSHSASVCALLVWKPASPNDTITRILITGATPQAAVFEGLDRVKSLAIFQQATCSEKSLSAPSKPAAAGAGARKPASKGTATPQPPAAAAAAAAGSKSVPAAAAAKPDQHNVSKQAAAAASGAAGKGATKTEPKKSAPIKEAQPKTATSPTKSQAQKSTKQAAQSAAKKIPVPAAATSATAAEKKDEQSTDASVTEAELIQLADTAEESSAAVVAGVVSESGALGSPTDPSQTDDLLSPSSSDQQDVINDKVQLLGGVDADRDIDTSVHSDVQQQHEEEDVGYDVDGQAAGYEGVKPEGLPHPQLASEQQFSGGEEELEEQQQQESEEQEAVSNSSLVEHADNISPAPAGAESRSEDDPESFDPQAQWGQPLGLPAPNKPPGGDGQASGGSGDAKKGTSAQQSSKPPAKANNGKDQAGKLNESVNKPPASLGRKPAAAAAAGGSRPQSSVDHHTSMSANPKTASASRPPAAAAATAAKKTATATGKPASLKPVVPFYVDLAYIPGHGEAEYVDGDFFRRVRARYYVLSTVNPDPQLLTALLDAKATWENGETSAEVTLIPTYDAEVLRYWMGAHRDTMSRLRVEVAPAANRCTIQLQDQEQATCSAYRLEF